MRGEGRSLALSDREFPNISADCRRTTILKMAVRLQLFSIYGCNLSTSVIQMRSHYYKLVETTSHHLCDDSVPCHTCE